MNKDLHDIDRLFRSIIEPHEEKPHPLTWHNIKSMLAKKSLRKKRFILFIQMIAALLVVFLSYTLYNTPNLTVTDKNKNTFSKTHTVNEQENYSKKPVDNNKATVANAETKKQTVGQYKKKDKTALAGNQSNHFVFPKSEYAKPVIFSDTIVAINNTNRNKVLYQNSIKPKIVSHSEPAAILQPKDTIPPGVLTETEMNDTAAVRVLKEKNPLKKKSPVKEGNSFKPYFSITGFSAREWAKYRLLDNTAQIGPISQQQQRYDTKKHIAEREKHEPSYASGLVVTYQFKRNLGLQAGLSYYTTTIIIKPHEVFADQQPNGKIGYKYITSSGYAIISPLRGLSSPNIGDSLLVLKTEDRLKYLSIPVLLTYSARFKKISLSASIGLSANFHLGSVLKTEIADSSNTEKITLKNLQGIKGFYADYLLITAVEYDLSKSWILKMQPYFRHALMPINKADNTVRTYPYSTGLGLGITYKF